MSAPEPGTYFIYNRVLDSVGQRLAATFNDDGTSITMIPLDTSSSKQQWVIQNRDGNTQYIRPKDNQSLVTTWDPTHSFVVTNTQGWWIITQDNGYVINDGERLKKWTLDSASDSSRVAVVLDVIGEKQRWTFHKVGTPLP